MTPRQLTGACVAVLASAGLGHAIVFTDRPTFDAAFPSLPGLQNFEAAGPLQRDYGDFVLSSGAAGGTGIGTTTSGFPSRVAVQAFADDRIDMDFTIPVEAVGLQVAGIEFLDPAIPRSAIITAFDVDGNTLETITLLTGGRAMTTFIGFGGLGEIARVRIQDLPLEAAYTAIDDVAYGVPAPSAGVFAGFFLLVAPRRIRR